MSHKFMTSNLLVELSTEEQQLLSGGQTTGDGQIPGTPPYTGQPSNGGQPILGGQSPIGEQPSYPSNGYGSRRYPTYVCRPVYGNDSSSDGN
ncbi:hypothetical protein LC593_20655 [Nostoc sp. CHAB 5844]|nr:hypothetical protein [Nostoc sp. CHAB 5844]